MRTWIDLPDRLLRARTRRHSAPARPDTRLVVAEDPFDDPAVAASDRLLRELAAAAILVRRGVATRVLVTNEPGTATRSGSSPTRTR
jgi:hypothetical protein